MSRKKGTGNKKESKFHIPPGVSVNFGDWTFIENIDVVGETYKYRLRCCCGTDVIHEAKDAVTGRLTVCKKCHCKKMRKAKMMQGKCV